MKIGRLTDWLAGSRERLGSVRRIYRAIVYWEGIGRIEDKHSAIAEIEFGRLPRGRIVHPPVVWRGFKIVAPAPLRR